jgi:hypothetical protein
MAIDINITLERTKSYGKVLIPSDFDFSENLQIIRPVGDSGILMNKSIHDYRSRFDSPIIKYVDQITGNDSNSGDDWNNAYKTLTKLKTVSFNRAYFKKGNYTLLSPSVFNGENEYICVDGMANFVFGLVGSDRTWINLGDGVWSNSLSANITCVCESDLYDLDGNLLRYTNQNSLSEVESIVGSFWKDNSTNTIYIHTLDGLTPARGNLLLGIARIANVGIKNYCENIRILLGFENNNSSATKRYILLNKCESGFNTTENNINIRGNVFFFFEKCASYKSFRDGFAYYASGAYSPHGIEFNCHGYLNGENNTNSINNGSTLHGNSRIVRIGGVYWGNEGRNVHDVNSSQSLNIDCVSYDSSSTSSGSKSAFAVGASIMETCKMWLDGCVAVDTNTFGAENLSADGNLMGRFNSILNIKPGTNITTY